MLQKFKSKINEVSEEVKRDPRFQSGIASVNKFASDLSLSNIGTPLSSEDVVIQTKHLVSSSSTTSEPLHRAASSINDKVQERRSSVAEQHMNVPTSDTLRNQENQRDIADISSLTNSPSLLESKNPCDYELNTSPVNMNQHQSDLFCLVSDEENELFPESSHFDTPIHDDEIVMPESSASIQQKSDSMEGGEDCLIAVNTSTELSREELISLIGKARERYSKYKNRCMEYDKTSKNMNRRIGEIQEQCEMGENAKRHLEQELNNQLEEKDHIINALQMKISLLKTTSTKTDEKGKIVLLKKNEDSEEQVKEFNNKHLTDKIDQLENILMKCRESLKEGKEKNILISKENQNLNFKIQKIESNLKSVENEKSKKSDELCKVRDELKREREEKTKTIENEEIQFAQTKMKMHQELSKKEDQISKISAKLSKIANEKEVLEKNLSVEEDLNKKRLTEIRILNSESSKEMKRREKAWQEISDKKIKDLHNQMIEEKRRECEMMEQNMKSVWEKERTALIKEHERMMSLKEDDLSLRLHEKEVQCKLAMEDIQLRLNSILNTEYNKSKLIADLESKINSLGVNPPQILVKEKSSEEPNSPSQELAVGFSNTVSVSKKPKGLSQELIAASEESNVLSQKLSVGFSKADKLQSLDEELAVCSSKAILPPKEIIIRGNESNSFAKTPFVLSEDGSQNLADYEKQIILDLLEKLERAEKCLKSLEMQHKLELNKTVKDLNTRYEYDLKYIENGIESKFGEKISQLKRNFECFVEISRDERDSSLCITSMLLKFVNSSLMKLVSEEKMVVKNKFVAEKLDSEKLESLIESKSSANLDEFRRMKSLLLKFEESKLSLQDGVKHEKLQNEVKRQNDALRSEIENIKSANNLEIVDSSLMIENKRLNYDMRNLDKSVAKSQREDAEISHTFLLKVMRQICDLSSLVENKKDTSGAKQSFCFCNSHAKEVGEVDFEDHHFQLCIDEHLTKIRVYLESSEKKKENIECKQGRKKREEDGGNILNAVQQEKTDRKHSKKCSTLSTDLDDILNDEKVCDSSVLISVKSFDVSPSSPEFEYLRNVLFHYMCGQDRNVLFKVLISMLKFSETQISVLKNFHK